MKQQTTRGAAPVPRELFNNLKSLNRADGPKIVLSSG